jgi:hypothetical protein
MAMSKLVEGKIIDKTFLNKEHNQQLSLQLSDSQLKAAWFDIPSNYYIGFQSFEINKDFDWPTVFAHLFPIEKQYKSVSLSIVNKNYTLVPKGIFDETAIDSYLKFNLGNINGVACYDSINSIGANIVYAENNPITNKIHESLPGIKTMHFGKSILEAFSIEDQNSNPNLFVHIQENRFDISCFQNKKLQFFNSFEYKTAEDFIYFLLYVMEQLQIDRETCKLNLCGEIEENSSIYKLVFKYIRNIEMLSRPKSAKYSLILNEIPKSYHYSLFNQYLCE